MKGKQWKIRRILLSLQRWPIWLPFASWIYLNNYIAPFALVTEIFNWICYQQKMHWSTEEGTVTDLLRILLQYRSSFHDITCSCSLPWLNRLLLTAEQKALTRFVGVELGVKRLAILVPGANWWVRNFMAVGIYKWADMSVKIYTLSTSDGII